MGFTPAQAGIRYMLLKGDNFKDHTEMTNKISDFIEIINGGIRLHLRCTK